MRTMKAARAAERKQMKKKILAVMLSAAIAATMLAGCGEIAETGGRTETDTFVDDSRRENEDKDGSDDKSNFLFGDTDSNGSMFSGTIFDEIAFGKTTEEELLQLLDDQGLNYDLDPKDFRETSTSDISYVSTGTMYNWDVYYEYIVDEQTHILIKMLVYFDIKDNAEHKDLMDFLQKIQGYHPINKFTFKEKEYDTIAIDYYDNTAYNDKEWLRNSKLTDDAIVMLVGPLSSYEYNIQTISSFSTAAVTVYAMNEELFPKTGTVIVNFGTVHATGKATTTTGAEDTWLNGIMELTGYQDIDAVNAGLRVDVVVLTNIEITLDLDARTIAAQAYDSEGAWGNPVISHI